MEAIGTNDAIGTAPRVFTLMSPLWGKCRVVPRQEEPTATVAMGYVALAGDPDNLKLAIWADGKWLKPNLKPFPLPVVQSYYAEQADGSPLF